MWDLSRDLRVRKMCFEGPVTESQDELAWISWDFKINIMAGHWSLKKNAW